MCNPLEMAQNAPKLQTGFPARCQSSAPQTNTFNLTVKLDFSTLPLRLWGRRSIPCHSLSCTWGVTDIAAVLCPNGKTQEFTQNDAAFLQRFQLSWASLRTKSSLLILLFVFSAFPVYGAHTQQDKGALACDWEKERVHRKQFTYSSVRTTVERVILGVTCAYVCVRVCLLADMWKRE